MNRVGWFGVAATTFGMTIILLTAQASAIPEGATDSRVETFINNVTSPNAAGQEIPVTITITSVRATFSNEFNVDSPPVDRATGAGIPSEADFCTGAILAPNRRCPLLLEITTGDASGANDMDFGTADITVTAIASFTDQTTFTQDFTFLRITEMAVINDPVPEPATITLLLMGILGLIGLRFAKRACNASA
jgi:hypothetical protein